MYASLHFVKYTNLCHNLYNIETIWEWRQKAATCASKATAK